MEWKFEPLGDIAFMTSGGTPNSKISAYYENGTIPWVRSGELENGAIRDTEIKITQAGLDNSSAKIFPKGTLLIALYGATIGKLAYLDIDACTNQAVCGIFENDKVSLKYLYYFLLFHRPDLVKQGVGGAQSNISQTILKKLMVSYPVDKAEQLRIVARIEELFSELDNGVETLQKTKQQLAVYRQAALRDAFSGLDTFTSLQTISERIFDGPFGSNLKTSDYTSSGIRVVRLENLKDGWFDDSKQSFVTQEKYITISSHTIYPTDLIMSTFIADSIKVCQMPESVGFAVNKADCIGIRLKSNYMQQYVMYYLMTKTAYNSLIHEVHGATRPRVNTKQIKGIQIPVCDLSVQRQIVANIESRLSVCDSIEKTVDTALQQAEAMRQSILKQAFEGVL